MKNINELANLISEEYNNIAAIMVSKDGNIKYENYFNGYNRDELIHVASVAKSITSILVGIAIDKGYICSVNDKIIDYFPNFTITKKNEIARDVTIQNVLTMTVPYKCKYEPYTKVYSSYDWVTATLNLIGGKGKIGEFKYITAGVQLLSGIISSKAGMSLREFANEYLFKPLEIEEKDSFLYKSKKEHIAYVKEKGFATGWVEDKNQVSTGGWGIPLTVRDMIKIGELCINEGSYNGKRIVSQKWIIDSTKGHIEVSLFGKNFKYGYYWWNIEDMQYPTFNALGDSGNVICCIPKLNMVIAIASSFYPRAKDRMEIINKFIIPLFYED